MEILMSFVYGVAFLFFIFFVLAAVGFIWYWGERLFHGLFPRFRFTFVNFPSWTETALVLIGMIAMIIFMGYGLRHG
jgi:hypothetical protein